MGNDPSDGFLQKSGPQPNDLPIGKQIEQKGPHILKPLGTAEVQQQNTYFVLSIHTVTLPAPLRSRQENVVLSLDFRPWQCL
jgi:hypothetical protein